MEIKEKWIFRFLAEKKVSPMDLKLLKGIADMELGEEVSEKLEKDFVGQIFSRKTKWASEYDTPLIVEFCRTHPNFLDLYISRLKHFLLDSKLISSKKFTH